jgi:adenine deaminase
VPDLELVAVALGQSPADLVIRGGNLVNVFTAEIYPADVAVYGSKIAAVGDVSGQTGPDTKVIDASGFFLVPGLIDGHLHVECSKLSITMFANAVVPLGTTSIVSGLDQICVVAGLEGVREFLDEAALGPLGVFWGAPSKLPYTFPESTVGHTFGPEEHAKAQGWPECVGLWETVQEFVFERDPKVMEAMDMARRNRLPVFSCAPLAEGAKIAALACAGFRADHECYSAEETLAKLRNGMYVMIRESSVAHFLAENLRVITEHKAKADRIGFCTDDVTATDILSQGHLDHLVRMAIERIYRIDHLAGSISPGRVADVLMIDDPSSFRVRRVVAKGKLVAEDGQMIVPASPPARSPRLLHTISVERVESADLQLRADPQATSARVLSMAMSDEVPFVRKRRDVELDVRDGVVLPDVERDVLYVTVVERYGKSSHRPVAFVSGFGLKAGAMASSASPDDNNILCIGTNPKDMATAINHLAAEGGGQVVVRDGEVLAFLSLPIGGIVADLPPQDMALMEAQLDEAARGLGCRLASPFMYLIFLSITAIPDYAITDLGLIDCVSLKAMSPLLEQTVS